MSKDFATYVLSPFKRPPSLADALRRASSGNCEHPSALKEPKNPKLTGTPSTSISIPGSGKGNTGLTLAFEIFDDKNNEFEDDRLRWLEDQLSPSREGGGTGTGTGGGAPLQIVSGSPSTLTVSPETVQTQGTDTITWTLTVLPAASGAYYA
jgi:hypothetical protein